MATIDLARNVKNIGKRAYSTYFSGMCARIYFGDYWVDEIVEIEWQLQENVAPIFGYASHTWDKVARGNRYVVGQFVINYKEVGYLQTILDSLSSRMTEGGAAFDERKFKDTRHQTSVEDVIENFDLLANQYEDSLWGTGENAMKDLVNSRPADTFFYGDNHNKDNTHLKDHGFNILITYGSGDTSNQSCAKNGIKDVSNYGSGVSKTAQTIVGVQLTGVSQRIDPSGQALQEVYTFIAKDIEGNVKVPY